MRAILTGGRYPHSLLAAVVVRMRADRNITGLRAAICKASFARDHRLGFEKEDVPMSLNPKETNPAYRLGRLFAVYENVQRAALPNINSTIKDRYFGAGAATELPNASTSFPHAWKSCPDQRSPPVRSRPRNDGYRARE